MRSFSGRILSAFFLGVMLHLIKLSEAVYHYIKTVLIYTSASSIPKGKGEWQRMRWSDSITDSMT